MEKRLGFVGIIVENRQRVAAEVNRVLSHHGDLIVARLGLPYLRRGLHIITLVVDATTDELGQLTGRLGRIEGVTVRSALAKTSQPKVPPATPHPSP